MKDDRLISLNAAIDAADRADYTGLAVEDVKKVTDEVVKELKQLPSAQPQRTGRWIKVNGKTAINCSSCYHCSWSLSFEDTVKRFNFCPNCGADMRNAGEIAKDIMHEAINHSVWSDTVNVEKMHRVVDDKYADMRGEQDE